MLKSELIAALQAIEGDPRVFLIIDGSWSTKRWEPEIHVVQEDELINYDSYGEPAIGETVVLL